MRWWIFAYWYEPGATRDPVGLVRIWQLAEQLTRCGDAVTIFPPNYLSSRRPRLSAVRPVRVIPIRFLRQVSYALGSIWAALREGARQRPDVLYYRWMESPHPLLLAKLFGAWCVCEVNGEPALRRRGASGQLGVRVREWAARLALPRCDQVVVLTEGLKRLVCDRYRVRPEAVLVLPSATDLELFGVRDRQQARVEGGLPAEATYIGFVGTMYRYQGLTTLLEAFASLRRRQPGLLLVLVGDGEMAGSLREQAEGLGVSEAIVWTGRVPYEQVPRWIAAMDVCVAPFQADRGETSPVKVFDYLAGGRPVVASAISCVTATFSRETGVVLVPPDDPQALADAVQRLLDDPAGARELGARGRRFVEQGGGWARLAGVLRTWVHPGTSGPPGSVTSATDPHARA